MDAGAHERGRQVRARLLAAAGLATAGLAAAGPAAAGPAAPGVARAHPRITGLPTRAHPRLTGLPSRGALPARGAELTGNLLVLLGGGGAQAAAAGPSVRAVMAAEGAGRAGHSVPAIGLITVRPPRGLPLVALARRLRAVPGVASVQLEHRYAPRAAADDPALTQTDPSAGVPYQWYLSAERFPAAWALARGSRALVGVIDTGIDATHPELAAKISAAVDQQDPSDARGTARTDEVGHGTHVASLACASTDDGAGMAGAGYGCRLISEKSDFSDSSIAAAIVDATDRGALALNMSFGPSAPQAGGPAPDSEVRALRYAAGHRVVLVAAAADTPGTEQGDPANVLQPAGTGPQLDRGLGLDVTAAAYDGARAPFAGRGSEISLAAYGAFRPSQAAGPLTISCLGTPVGILGAYPAGATDLERPPATACRTSLDGDSRYAYLAGTSMAAPQVAAAAALMRERNPYATLPDILRTIKLTARRPPGQGWSSDLGWGILDAGAAVSAIRRVDRLPPIAVVSAPRTSRTGRFTVRWRGRDQRPPGLIASGIAYYLVYVSVDHRPPRLIAHGRRHALAFRGRRGGVYRFTVYAVDRAGNREVTPAVALTRVG